MSNDSCLVFNALIIFLGIPQLPCEPIVPGDVECQVIVNEDSIPPNLLSDNILLLKEVELSQITNQISDMKERFESTLTIINLHCKGITYLFSILNYIV